MFSNRRYSISEPNLLKFSFFENNSNNNNNNSSKKNITTENSNHFCNSSREIIKEGIVNYVLVCETFEQEWKKCRLVLVKTENDYSTLEFYSPLKSLRPKCGLFCFLINEVRQTKPLEMPEKPFTFVIRFSNLIEYIIETGSYSELSDWLRTIKQQIVRHSNNGIDQESNLSPEIYFSKLCSMLEMYPWFHRNISRHSSASLVLKGGSDWSGVFLVRPSESRIGELVLTFNCHGNAKNLRIAIKAEGQCTIEQLCFSSIFNLLEHFRNHTMPLKNDKRLLLTRFVVHTKEDSNYISHRISLYENSYVNSNSEKSKVCLFSGSVRITSEELKSMIGIS